MADAAIGLGFHVWGSEIWTGGVHYAADLMRALHETYRTEVRSFLLVYGGTSPLAPLVDAADNVLVYPQTRRWSTTWWRERIPKRVFKHDVVAHEFLAHNGIDVIVFGDAPLGSNVPTIGQIPDFQAFHLPEFFSAQELALRRAEVQRVGSLSTRLVVYSKSVQADMERFAPQFAAKTRVVSPVCNIPASAYAPDPANVAANYHLPERFFYVPNQFWQHKNHLLVLEALAHLRERGITPFVAMTGLFHDHRAPEFTGHFLRRVSELDLRDQIAILGLVPRQDVYALMRQSLAVLNPSLFEGFGMTVAETRWLGKRAILSDISAHRAQQPPHAMYFDPRNANALADTLEQTWREYVPGPDAMLEAEAKRNYPEHKRHCAQEFMNVVKEIVRK